MPRTAIMGMDYNIPRPITLHSEFADGFAYVYILEHAIKHEFWTIGSSSYAVITAQRPTRLNSRRCDGDFKRLKHNI